MKKEDTIKVWMKSVMINRQSFYIVAVQKLSKALEKRIWLTLFMRVCVARVSYIFGKFSLQLNVNYRKNKWRLCISLTSAFATYYFWFTYIQKMTHLNISVATSSRPVLLYHILCFSYVNERIRSAQNRDFPLWSNFMIFSKKKSFFVMKINSHSWQNLCENNLNRKKKPK